jgi:hypothetical protein
MKCTKWKLSVRLVPGPLSSISFGPPNKPQCSTGRLKRSGKFIYNFSGIFFIFCVGNFVKLILGEVFWLFIYMMDVSYIYQKSTLNIIQLHITLPGSKWGLEQLGRISELDSAITFLLLKDAIALFSSEMFPSCFESQFDPGRVICFFCAEQSGYWSQVLPACNLYNFPRCCSIDFAYLASSKFTNFDRWLGAV